ncbi:MAG: hypothetical protein NTW96_26235 [Planctomycetia bacterium]|nr:hypothetical protein [Planctomycetia bacterium]
MGKAMSDGPSVVAQLFQAIGIKRVVYVDDQFGITRERLATRCRDLTVEQLTASGVFPGVEFPEDDEPLREQRLKAAIDKVSDKQLEPAFDAIAELPNGTGKKDRDAAKGFTDLLGEATDLKLLSLSQWRSQSKNLAQEYGTVPTLFIFDDDFQLEGGAEEEGRRTIDQLHGELKQYKHAYALLTHKAADETEEETLYKAIVEQYPAIADYLVVIAKARLVNGDRNRFVHRLKATLLYRLFRVVRQKLTAATTEANAVALQEIEKLGLEAFERIVFRSSQEEGAWSPETLTRLFGVTHERHVRSRLRKDVELHKAVANIDPLCSIETQGVSDAVRELAEELQQLEMYDGPDELNQLHLPIEVGDIFASQNGNQCILVAQPCDLVVRAKGLRRGDTRDKRQVAALLTIQRRDVSAHNPLRAHEHVLPHYAPTDKKTWYSLVNQAMYLPVWVLDLCVLNTDGRCRIGKDDVCSGLFTLPWRKRQQVLTQRCGELIELFDSLAAPKQQEAAELIRSLLRFPLGIKVEASVEPAGRKPGDPWEIRIDLRRVRRLRERYAVALLTHYSSHLSRLGQPHDLTRG